jgi:hypothetical protein
MADVVPALRIRRSADADVAAILAIVDDACGLVWTMGIQDKGGWMEGRE